MDLARRVLPNGDSVISERDACNMLLNLGEIPPHIKVEHAEGLKSFRLYFGTDLEQNDAQDASPLAKRAVSDYELGQLEAVLKKPRDNTPIEIHDEAVLAGSA